MNTLLIAVFTGLSGMIGWGLADFFAKKTVDKIGDLATLAWAHVCGVILLAILVVGKFFSEGTIGVLPENANELGLIAGFGALQALVYYFAYRAFSKGKLAILNPIFSSYSGFVVILSVLVFGEILGLLQLATLGLVFLGILTISVDDESLLVKQLKLNKHPGVPDILMAVLLAALWTVLWGHFVIGKDWLLYASIMYVFMTITIFILCMFQNTNLRVRDTKIWKYFVFIGIGEVVAYVGVSIGYSLTTHTSIVAVLSAAFSVPTLILAHYFLRERITFLQKIGVGLVIVGVSALPLL
ncbi:MAG: EamA family transporter [Patescibacteria group bacterium]